MKRIALLSGALVLLSLISSGQTNSEAGRSQMYSLAPMPLRTPALLEPAESEVVEWPHVGLKPPVNGASGPRALLRTGRLLDRGADVEAAAAPETVKIFAGNLSVRNPNSLSEPTAAVTEGNESDTYHRLDIYRRLEQGGYLVGSASQSPVEHYVDRIFRPEIIHLGKASVACTLVTAIRHKDLLCLINPMVVWVSW